MLIPQWLQPSRNFLYDCSFTPFKYLQVIKCPAIASALRAEAPRDFGLVKNIIETAGHFIISIPLNREKKAALPQPHYIKVEL